jgi:hypothetical protein
MLVVVVAACTDPARPNDESSSVNVSNFFITSSWNLGFTPNLRQPPSQKESSPQKGTQGTKRKKKIDRGFDVPDVAFGG